MKIEIEVDVVDSEFDNRYISSETTGWSVRINYGRGDLFVGCKVYNSIDGAYRARERIEKKLNK